jgi:hypothetical protein
VPRGVIFPNTFFPRLSVLFYAPSRLGSTVTVHVLSILLENGVGIREWWKPYKRHMAK